MCIQRMQNNKMYENPEEIRDTFLNRNFIIPLHVKKYFVNLIS